MDSRAAVAGALVAALCAVVAFWWVVLLGELREGPTLSVERFERGTTGSELAFRIQNVSTTPIRRQNILISCSVPPCFRETEPGEWVVREYGPLFRDPYDTGPAQVLLRVTLAPGAVAQASVWPADASIGTVVLRVVSDDGDVPALVQQRWPVGIALEHYVAATTTVAIAAIMLLAALLRLLFLQPRSVPHRPANDGPPPGDNPAPRNGPRPSDVLRAREAALPPAELQSSPQTPPQSAPVRPVQSPSKGRPPPRTPKEPPHDASPEPDKPDPSSAPHDGRR